MMSLSNISGSLNVCCLSLLFLSVQKYRVRLLKMFRCRPHGGELHVSFWLMFQCVDDFRFISFISFNYLYNSGNIPSLFIMKTFNSIKKIGHVGQAEPMMTKPKEKLYKQISPQEKQATSFMKNTISRSSFNTGIIFQNLTLEYAYHDILEVSALNICIPPIPRR